MVSKKGLRVRTKHVRDDLSHEIKEMFIGHHTVFSIIGLGVGMTLITKTLSYWSIEAFGHSWTAIIGVVVFIISGLLLHSFDEHSTSEISDEIDDVINEIIER